MGVAVLPIKVNLETRQDPTCGQDIAVPVSASVREWPQPRGIAKSDHSGSGANWDARTFWTRMLGLKSQFAPHCNFLLTHSGRQQDNRVHAFLQPT